MIKDQLEHIPNYGRLRHILDLPVYTKSEVTKYNIRPRLYTNAWRKIYELLEDYPLISENKHKLKYIDLCSAPGAFLIAINHFVRTRTAIRSLDWYGQSLSPKIDQTALKDQYGILKAYPKKMLYGPTQTGNLTNMNNIRGYQKQLGALDLVTGDCGVQVIKDAEQENENLFLHAGQIVAMLYLLKKGGNGVLKMYSFFDMPTVSWLYLLTACFDQVIISKPISSRPANSETYIVCLGYHKLSKKYLDHLGLVMEIFSPEKSLFMVPNKFVKEIYHIHQKIVKRQIITIKKYLNIARIYKDYRKLERDMEYYQSRFNDKYFKKYPYYSISNKDKLI